MTIEKMLPGRTFTTAIGIALILTGTVVMAATLAGYWGA
jgi:hypothetical protein